MAKNVNPSEGGAVGRRSHGGAHREALLDAAMDLLAAHGPDGFSSRDVAKAAGVSYGLIHYHFGSRTELLREALQQDMRRYAASVGSIDEAEWVPLLVTAPMPDRAWRALVQIAVHWDAYGELVRDFPLLSRRLSVLSERYHDEIDDVHLRATLVVSGCLQVGWHAAAPWCLEAMGGGEQLRAVVDELLVQLEGATLQIAMQMFAAGSATD